MPRSTVNTIRAGAGNLFAEYCSNSSVHCVGYFGCRKRTCCEKFGWLAVFALSVGSCAVLIGNVYRKWQQSPVIVSFDEKTTPVWQIPFPAVTICPQIKTFSATVNYTKHYHEFEAMSQEDRLTYNKTNTLMAMAQICGLHTFTPYASNDTLDFPNKTCHQSYASLIGDITLSMHASLVQCAFEDTAKQCADIFSYSMTEQGICFTFNGLSVHDLLRTEVIQREDPYLGEQRRSPDWTLSNGFRPGSRISTYPQRVIGSGTSYGLKLLMFGFEELMDYICSGPVLGFKVLLHSPADYPQVLKRFDYVPLDQHVTFTVKPQIITTTSGLQHYKPEDRQCYFNDERYLKFFRVYTQANCELECLTNYTLNRCGCVKFSMLRTNETAVCETNQMRCMKSAEYDINNSYEMWSDYKTVKFKSYCDCLPACTSIQYDAEINQVEMKWRNLLHLIPNHSIYGHEKAHFGLLQVHFKDSQFLTSKRSELYGLTDFIANCGGLLGLCMGISLLSVVELMYFCSVRPFMLWREYRSLPRDKGTRSA